MIRFAYCLAALLLALPFEAHARQSVLMIVLDDVGVANIGAYGVGQTPPPTPNIDRLARRGVLFRNAWSNPLCSPTRACIQAGRYSFRTGVGNSVIGLGPTLQDAETTIPELFPQVPSGAFGKWHLGWSTDTTSPNRQGYQNYQGGIFGVRPSYYFWPYTQNGQTSMKVKYAPTTNVDDAIAWIASQSGDWFAYLALNSAHAPFHNPPPALHSYRLVGDNRTLLNQYKAAIQAADTELGRLLATINLEEVTVLLVGDNGTDTPVVEPPFDPNRSKGTVYQGGVWVPLIVAGREVVQGGREVASIVHVTDLFATVAELMGASQTTGVDAVSLVPYLRDPQSAPLRKTMYSEVFDSHKFVSARTIRNQRFKLLQQALNPAGDIAEEFYDLTADPFEQKNQIGNRSYRGAITTLRLQMNALAGPKLR